MLSHQYLITGQRSIDQALTKTFQPQIQHKTSTEIAKPADDSAHLPPCRKSSWDFHSVFFDIPNQEFKNMLFHLNFKGLMCLGAIINPHGFRSPITIAIARGPLLSWWTTPYWGPRCGNLQCEGLPGAGYPPEMLWKRLEFPIEKNIQCWKSIGKYYMIHYPIFSHWKDLKLGFPIAMSNYQRIYQFHGKS